MSRAGAPEARFAESTGVLVLGLVGLCFAEPLRDGARALTGFDRMFLPA